MAGTHARLSASAAHRWLRCAGSLGEGTSSQYAATGTFAHDIAAKCLTEGAQPSDFLLKKGEVEGFPVECDQEMVEAVGLYLDAIAADTVEHDRTWVEMPLADALRKIDPDLGGTADFVRYRPGDKTLRVWDFKYGEGTYVEAESNEQMQVYALGAMLHVGLPVEQVEVTIVQPRYEGAKPVRSWIFDAVDILDFVADVQEAAERTRLSNPPLVAGEHCAPFCPNRRTCPELTKKQHALVAAQFADLTVVPAEDIGRALADIPLVEARIKALKEHAYAEAMRGVEVPGYKLVEKRATRKWARVADVVEWAEARAIDPYAPRELLSPAQIEAKLKETAPRGKKKDAGKELEPLVERVSSGYALVALSDERPPAKRISATDFAVVGGTADESNNPPPQPKEKQ